jgi:hypothetical protein
MNKKIRRMMQEIKRRGGTIGMPGSLPDDVAERFLEEVLSCPDCHTRSFSGDDAARDAGTGMRNVVVGSRGQ